MVAACLWLFLRFASTLSSLFVLVDNCTHAVDTLLGGHVVTTIRATVICSFGRRRRLIGSLRASPRRVDHL